MIRTILRNPLYLGLSGCVVAFLAGSMVYAISLPVSGTADAPLHLDYAWQLSKGHLPDFNLGIQAPVGIDYDVQYVSQHPPLYYLLILPVSVLIDIGEPGYAMLAARLITILIATLSIFAFFWLGKEITKGDKVLSLLIASFATSLVPYVKVGADVMNDSLYILFCTLALASGISIIRQGLTRRRLIIFCLIAIGGMATRATFVSTLGLVLTAIFIDVYWRVPTAKPALQRLWHSIKLPLITILFISIAVGWFYIRNYKLSGSWFRSGPQEWAALIQGRQYKSLDAILHSANFWWLLPSGLYGNSWSGLLNIGSKAVNYWGSALLFFTLLPIGVWDRLKSSLKLKDRQEIIVYLLLIGLIFAPLLLQLQHATGYGALNFRYLLSSMIPISVFILLGINKIGKDSSGLKYSLALGLVIINWLAVVLNTIWFVSYRYADKELGIIGGYLSVITRLPAISYVVVISLLVLIAGLIIQVYSIKKITVGR